MEIEYISLPKLKREIRRSDLTGYQVFLCCMPRPAVQVDQMYKMQASDGNGDGLDPVRRKLPNPLHKWADPPPPTQARERAGGRPPHPPPRTPPSWGATGAALRPPPRRDGDAVGGAAAGPAPASRHWRAGATRTTEQCGGRAPHDPPVTTAHSGRAEGGFRSARAPGGAVHGPPLTPPHPGAALRPRPHAHAGRERAGDTKGARMEYRRPPPRRGAGRPRRDTPPPRPPTGPQAAGAPAPSPRGRGDGLPPRPREEPERDPPPRPSRRLPWGPRRTSEPAPTHQDAAQIVPREAW